MKGNKETKKPKSDKGKGLLLVNVLPESPAEEGGARGCNAPSPPFVQKAN